MAKRAKDNTGRYVVSMRLYPEKWQIDVLEKRFRIVQHLQNSLIAFEKRKLQNLQHTIAWRQLEKTIETTPKEEREQLYTQRRIMLRDAKFTEFDFMADMMPMQKHFQIHIAAHIAEQTARDVWRAFEMLLFGKAKSVSLRNNDERKSVATKKSAMRIKGGFFIWCGGRVIDKDGKKRVRSSLCIRMQQPSTQYEISAFNNSIASYRVVKKWLKSSYHWYVQITFKGVPPQKKRLIGSQRVGISIGASNIAIVSENSVILRELAPASVNTYYRKKAVQRKMARSLRLTNPHNFNDDGLIKNGIKLTYVRSKRYMKLQGVYRELARKEAAQRKHEHILLANSIISIGTQIYQESMTSGFLQHPTNTIEPDYANGYHNRERRSITHQVSRAPSILIRILNDKLKNLGKTGIIAAAKSNSCISQYDHTTGEQLQISPSAQMYRLGNGDSVQCNLYRAWLLLNSDDTLSHLNQIRCQETYSSFKILHDMEIGACFKPREPNRFHGI